MDSLKFALISRIDIKSFCANRMEDLLYHTPPGKDKHHYVNCYWRKEQKSTAETTMAGRLRQIYSYTQTYHAIIIISLS